MLNNNISTKTINFPVFILTTIMLTLTILLLNTSITIAVQNHIEYENVLPYDKVVAHGGGAFKGYETTNSVEAFKNAINNGYRIIELDLELSFDDKIIMLHDWDRTTVHYLGKSFDKKILESQFLNLSIHGQLEVMTFDKLVEILKESPGIKIITDTKGDNIKILSKIAKDYPDSMERIIPQIYEYDQLETVRELGYTDIIFTLYTQPAIHVEELIQFVKENNIYAIAMPDYYADKGYCKNLADTGIKVYIHPVGSFEKAMSYMNNGAYGIYTGILLPQELNGIEKDYYLVTVDGSGKQIKLTDKYINSPEELIIKGLKAGEYIRYAIDDNKSSANIQFSDYKDGKHKLTIEIYSKAGSQLGILEYFIWINKEGKEKVRILHKKYEYRLEGIVEVKDFNAVMEEYSASEELKEVLINSFIAKVGDYWYYNNGVASSFMNGKDFLPVQKSSNGRVLLPLGTTALELGAKSVAMEKGKDMVIEYDNSKIRSVINSYIIRNSFRVYKIKLPITLYINKAMAGGEICQYITGRTYIEKNGLIIILPKNIKNRNYNDQLMNIAHELFNK